MNADKMAEKLLGLNPHKRLFVLVNGERFSVTGIDDCKDGTANISVEKIKPKHEHDCDNCVFLGREEDLDVDLYFCPRPDYKNATVVYRYSNEGSDYGSGLAFFGVNPLATEATRLAIEAGLITEEQVAWHSRIMREHLEKRS